MSIYFTCDSGKYLIENKRGSLPVAIWPKEKAFKGDFKLEIEEEYILTSNEGGKFIPKNNYKYVRFMSGDL